MTKKTLSSNEEFASEQSRLAALNPAIAHFEPSLIDIVAPDQKAPESHLPQRIKYVRNDLVLSVEALSRLTKEYDLGGGGLSPTSISRYESGDALPGLREFRLIAESLDVPVAWLLYGTVEKIGQEFSDAERQLLTSLRGLIAQSKDDSQIGNPSDSHWLKKQARMEKLNRARKPPVKE